MRFHYGSYRKNRLRASRGKKGEKYIPTGEDWRIPLASLPALIYSSSNFQIKPPFSEITAQTHGTSLQSPMGCLYYIPHGIFFQHLAHLQLCFIPDCPILTTDSMMTAAGLSPSSQWQIKWPRPPWYTVCPLPPWYTVCWGSFWDGIWGLMILCTWDGMKGFLFQKTTLSRIDCKINPIQSGKSQNRKKKNKEHEYMGLEPDSLALNPGVSCVFSVFWS